jgi:hypothetical protein
MPTDELAVNRSRVEPVDSCVGDCCCIWRGGDRAMCGRAEDMVVISAGTVVPVG